MIIDPVYEHHISALIESQFPAEIREVMGPVFVGFVQKYYEWLETQDQANYHTRRLMSYKDIDTTTDDFLIYFKEKYLKNIQLETTSNVKMLIKHSLDIYRSRGTPRAIDLLFRLVFGVGAEVYVPGNDIFRLSDGKWSRPIYLEIALRDDNAKFVGKEIIGLKSNARAFVERSIRRQSPSQLNDILYLSALVGNFETGELINAITDPFDVTDCPAIVGSMTTLSVVDGSEDFSVGDLVDITSAHGSQGVGRVTSVSNTTGTVDFELEDGGYGYSANAAMLVSEQVLGLANLVIDTNINNTHGYMRVFETIYQPLANITYINGTGNFASNDTITTYYPNNSIKGTGLVLNAVATNSTAGYVYVSVRSGNLTANAFYTAANAVSANQAVSGGYVDLTAQGNVISETANVIISVEDAVGTFQVGEEVYQTLTNRTSNATVTNTSITVGTGFLLVTDHIGAMIPGTTIRGRTSNATANVVAIELSVGVISINNEFITDTRALIGNTSSNLSAYVIRGSTGTGANVGVGSIENTETVNLNTDFIYAQLGINLDSTYLFTANSTANLTTNISACLIMNTFTVGSIATLGSINGGNNYNAKPHVRPYQAYVYPLKRRGYLVDVANVVGSFQEGERVSQSATGARGSIRLLANTSLLYLERNSLFKEFLITSNSTLYLEGEASGATANIVYVEPDWAERPINIDEEYNALDSYVSSNTQVSLGAILTMVVHDSGFGFVSNENATFVSQDGERQGQVRVLLGRQGRSQGFYKRTGGFLSHDKKLFDGYYYQDFSYEVRSSITLNKYQDMLKKILHVAGTVPFGAFYHRNVANAELVSESQTITQE